MKYTGLMVALVAIVFFLMGILSGILMYKATAQYKIECSVGGHAIVCEAKAE